MGEWSKKIGELGEGIVGEFLDLIGWGNSQKGLSLPCVRSNSHRISKNPRSEHGIDYLFSCESQLIDRTLDNLIISVKYTSEPYPSAPNGKFKEHFIDLARAIECFKYSQIKQDANSHFSGVERARNIGVLFWLSHGDPAYQDVIQKVARVRGIEENGYDSIYIADNKRVSFIYNTIKYIEKTRPDSEIEFFYQDTGKNNNPLSRKSSGRVLPVEFINSGILLIKLINPDNSKTFVVSVIDEFDRDSFKRLMGLSFRTMHDFAQDSLILFPNFDLALHENLVIEAKSSFRDVKFTGSVRVDSYTKDFRTCETAFTQGTSPKLLSNIEQGDFDREQIFKNTKHFLPYGEMLRGLLVQSCISKGELRTLLKYRGVFTPFGEKQDTIPLLVTTVLTPYEFDLLRENQNSREDNLKNNTQIIEWQSDKNLLEQLPELLNVASIANPEFDNYRVIRQPAFVPIENNLNHVKMDYSIERNDLSKCWATEKREFNASLEIIRTPETNTVKIITYSTAEETKKVATKVINNLLKHFEVQGNIESAKSIQRILFSSFSNSNRIQYFLSLTKNINFLIFEFVDIVDIQFTPEKNQDLPDEIKWIQGKIEDLKLNGKKLHNTLFLKKQYHEYIHLYSVDCKFKFDLKFKGKNITGECTICFDFPDYEKNSDTIDSELEINIRSLKVECDRRGFTQSELKQALLKELEDLKITNFKKYQIDDNQSQLAAVA